MTATAAPERPQTTPAPSSVKVCDTCGVRSYYAPGYEPVRRGWRRNTCSSCVQREISDRINRMSDAEKREAARAAILAAPTDSVNRIADRTGLARSYVLGIKRGMVRLGEAGWASPVKPKPKPATKRRSGGGANTGWREVAADRRAHREAEALTILRRLGPSTAEEVGSHLSDADRLKSPKRSAERLLHALKDQGKVVQTVPVKRPDGRGVRGNPATWTAKP